MRNHVDGQRVRLSRSREAAVAILWPPPPLTMGAGIGPITQQRQSPTATSGSRGKESRHSVEGSPAHAHRQDLLRVSSRASTPGIRGEARWLVQALLAVRVGVIEGDWCAAASAGVAEGSAGSADSRSVRTNAWCAGGGGDVPARRQIGGALPRGRPAGGGGVHGRFLVNTGARIAVGEEALKEHAPRASARRRTNTEFG